MAISTKKLLLIILSIIIILIIVCAVFYRTKSKDLDLKQEVQTVSVSSVTYQIIPRMVMTYGQTVSPVSTAIKAQASGVITAIMFKPGQAVTKGQLLLTLNTSDSSVQLKKLAAQMELSQQIYLRTQHLSDLAPDDVSTVDVLRAKLQYEQDLAQYQQAQAIYNVSSPINGIITDTALAAGDYVNAGDTLMTVVDPHSLQVRYQLPSRYANLVKVGQAVTFTPTNSADAYAATVSYVAPLVDEDVAGITLRANFTKIADLLSNRFGQITQVLDDHYRTLVVPQNLVQSDAQGFYVYLFKDSKVIKRYFDAGEITKSGLIEVQSGLASNDLLITSNPYILKEGQVVEVAQS